MSNGMSAGDPDRASPTGTCICSINIKRILLLDTLLDSGNIMMSKTDTVRALSEFIVQLIA